MDAKFKELPGNKFTIQVAPEDCTGCALCVEVCPAKDKTNVSRKAINMADQPPLREQESINWEFFLELPEADRSKFNPTTIKNSSSSTAVRVLRRVCGLRRDTLRQTGLPVLWRPDPGSQRHRLLVHLWRQPAHHTLGA